MSEKRAVGLKHERIVAVLETEIRSGSFQPGTQLPGELSLARRFAVSRSTVRSALAELSEAGLIATRSGKGSFVCYDGQAFDLNHGWLHGLAERGIDTRVQIIGMSRQPGGELGTRLGLPDTELVAIRRVRSLPDGVPISYERSFIAAVDPLDRVLEHGLIDQSITATLLAAGLVADHGAQQVGARPIDAREARLLKRDRGTVFLDLERTTWTEEGRFVEHVHSLLDPQHFQLRVNFVEPRS